MQYLWKMLIIRCEQSKNNDRSSVLAFNIPELEPPPNGMFDEIFVENAHDTIRNKVIVGHNKLLLNIRTIKMIK